MYERSKLGEILLKKEIIDKTQLEEVLKEQRKTGDRLGAILVKHNFASEEDIARVLSEQLNFPFFDLNTIQIAKEILKLIPEATCSELQVMPLSKIGATLTVALNNPLNMPLIDRLENYTHLHIRAVVATSSGIKQAIAKFYGNRAADIKSETKTGSKTISIDQQLKSLMNEASQAPVIELVNRLIIEAVDSRVSDIHLEPEEKDFFCRFRIDGILYDKPALPKELQNSVISRVKIMAGMDIAEKRLPQDGRIQIKTAGREVDLRVSTFPGLYGENVSIRILDKSQKLFKLEDLGFLPNILNKFKERIRVPYGIILITGPTGSGKTTTLYAILNTINDLQKNIVTLENPVEYFIPRVRQSQINPKIGFSFAIGLRSLVRQDPDIIMIGEIRDKETADVAVHSALTGHLVFSSLHTNDAPSAIIRLINMGTEPFLVSSSVSCILAQRLVRRLCPKCRKEYKPSEEELSLFRKLQSVNSTHAEEKNEEMVFYKEVGCKDCRNTGFNGRIGIFELLIPNEDIKKLINEKAAVFQLREAARKSGMLTLCEDGSQKVEQGITTISEILRVSLST